MSRLPWLEARLQGRAAVTVEEMWRRHFVDLPRHQVTQYLEDLKASYFLPIEKLLPDDPLVDWMTPPPTRNPILWLWRRGVFEHTLSDILYELERRQPPRREPMSPPGTLRDMVLLWCSNAKERG